MRGVSDLLCDFYIYSHFPPHRGQVGERDREIFIYLTRTPPARNRFVLTQHVAQPTSSPRLEERAPRRDDPGLRDQGLCDPVCVPTRRTVRHYNIYRVAGFLCAWLLCVSLTPLRWCHLFFLPNPPGIGGLGPGSGLGTGENLDRGVPRGGSAHSNWGKGGGSLARGVPRGGIRRKVFRKNPQGMVPQVLSSSFGPYARPYKQKAKAQER